MTHKTAIRITFAIFAFLIGAQSPAAQAQSEHNTLTHDTDQTATGGALESEEDPFYGKNLSGRYLSSLFAQRHHDWKAADGFLDGVIESTPHDVSLLKRKMVLAMGSGNFESAIDLARQVQRFEKGNTLAALFVAAQAFKNKDYDTVKDSLALLPLDGGLVQFMRPLLESWSAAALGDNKTQDLNSNTVHIHHAILIADFLEDYQHIEALLEKTLERGEVPPSDLERIGDIFAHIGKTDRAVSMYRQMLQQQPETKTVLEKIEKLEAGESVSYFEPVDTPDQGVARAFFDMAQMLYVDGSSDESARIFAYLALALDPDMIDSNLLLAEVYARNDHRDEAIKYYLQITPEHEYFIETQRRAADLMDESGDREAALSLLNTLAETYQDTESRIKIGDLFRRDEDFKNALIHYNKASASLDNDIPAEYWHLLYVRGMSYERTGEWEKAEKDLRAALEFQPEHPYVLNYLGYAWADQGQNLNEALHMIEQAVRLRPSDGYITDSLGWVHYRMGNYETAVPILEQAVALLPYDPVINDHLGDAYWMVGRRLEASFQWERAKNHSTDESLLQSIEQKLASGLAPAKNTRQNTKTAETDAPGEMTPKKN